MKVGNDRIPWIAIRMFEYFVIAVVVIVAVVVFDNQNK